MSSALLHRQNLWHWPTNFASYRQIQAACTQREIWAIARDGVEYYIGVRDLYTACRLLSNQNLAQLCPEEAAKVQLAPPDPARRSAEASARNLPVGELYHRSVWRLGL